MALPRLLLLARVSLRPLPDSYTTTFREEMPFQSQLPQPRHLYLYLTATFVTIRRLIQQARTHCRRNTHPTTKPPK